MTPADELDKYKLRHRNGKHNGGRRHGFRDRAVEGAGFAVQE
jgi:hypothetical protein